jgi:DNA-binding NtrC family response regulator
MTTVLIVDDRATNRELARVLLTYGGHRVIEAHEGAEALSLAHAQHPDLVLTDILMPGMDGYQLAGNSAPPRTPPRHPSCSTRPTTWRPRPGRSPRPAAWPGSC